MVRIGSQPAGEPIRSVKGGRADQAGGVGRSGRSADAPKAGRNTGAAPAGAVTSASSAARASIEPARRALGRAQDAVTFVQIGEQSLAEVEGVLDQIARASSPDEAAGLLGRIEEIAGRAVFEGQPVLADLSAAPAQFAVSADGEQVFSVAEDLRVTTDGSGGILSVDLTNAGPAELPGRASQAASDVAAARTRLATLGSDVSAVALDLASEIYGVNDLTDEDVAALVAQVTGQIRGDGGRGLAAQAGIESNTAGALLGS